MCLVRTSVPLQTAARAAVAVQPSRTTTSKHYDPKWKRRRAEKYLKIDLPDYDENAGTMSRERMRQKMKEHGLVPPRPWTERPFHISCTGGVFEPYVPPEGDGRASLVSGARAQQAVRRLEKKSKSMMAVRKIRSFDEDFDVGEFCRLAHEIYTRAHRCVADGDRHGLRLAATERAYPELRHNTLDKTLRWRLLDELEPPRLVHARCTDVVSKENIYAQVTVRFHTRQTLAVYDRFGRLMHGSEIQAKDVLEYVVFEKHLSDVYGTWRLHDKIVPEWTPPREPSHLTRPRPHSPPDVGLTTATTATGDS